MRGEERRQYLEMARGDLTMKLATFLCSFAVSVSIASSAADLKTPLTVADSAQKAVEARSRALIKAELESDVAAFRSFLSDDYVLLYVEPATAGHKAKWVARTREEWATRLQTGQTKYAAVEIRNTRVYLHGDVAIFAGEYMEKGTRDGRHFTEEGLFTETWVRRNGEWMMVGGVFP
jgi:ketosteroid isomerase-like protein